MITDRKQKRRAKAVVLLPVPEFTILASIYQGDLLQVDTRVSNVFERGSCNTTQNQAVVK